jgi:hypothetical protein
VVRFLGGYSTWELGDQKQLIIKYIFLQMVLLYRTLRQNKIFAAYTNKLKLIVSSQEQFINLYFLFSPVYEDKPENTILDFDTDGKTLNPKDILEILEKNTAIAEKYLIKKIKEYLGFSKKEEILEAQEVVLAHHGTYEQSQALFKSYQDFQNTINKLPILRLDMFIQELLDTTPQPLLENILPLITPFSSLSLTKEIALLNALQRQCQAIGDQEVIFIYPKVEWVDKIKILIEILQYIERQPALYQKQLYLFYKRNCKITMKVEELQNFQKNLQSKSFQDLKKIQNILLLKRFFKPEVIEDISEILCRFNITQNRIFFDHEFKYSFQTKLISHLARILNSERELSIEDSLHHYEILLLEVEKKSTVNMNFLKFCNLDGKEVFIKKTQQQIELLKSLQQIQDPLLQKTWYEYIRKNLNYFSSDTEIAEFQFFLKNKIYQQNYQNILKHPFRDFSETLHQLQNLKNKLEVTEITYNQKEQLDFSIKIYTLLHEVKDMSSNKLSFGMYLMYLFLSFFGVQAPPTKAKGILAGLENSLSVYVQTGLTEELKIDLQKSETLFNKIR